MKGVFATAINCMDGRVQTPVIEWIKKNYSIDFVDNITEPGPNKILAENLDETAVKSIQRRVEISVLKHGSNLIAIVGHHDCAGNPAEKEDQVQHIVSAIKTVQSWNFDAKLIGLWVDEQYNVRQVP